MGTMVMTSILKIESMGQSSFTVDDRTVKIEKASETGSKVVINNDLILHMASQIKSQVQNSLDNT